MKLRWLATATILLFAADAKWFSTKAEGAFESLFQVYQPLGLEEGIEIASVPYIFYTTDMSGGIEVGMTCAPNKIAGQDSVRNYNIASASGLKIQKVVASHRPHGLFGDTLKVVFDASSIKDSIRFWGESVDTILAATFECMLANAAKGWPAKYLSVEILGPSRFGQFTGVYKLASFSALPRRKSFGD